MKNLFKFKDENGRIIPKNIFWLAFFGVLLVCVLYVVVMLFIPVKVSANMEPRGAFGDMFGALGALFSGLAFAGLIVTMLQQREDLQNQKDEIVLQRDEIELQRKDLEAQTEALKLQKEEIAQTNKELQLQRAEMKEQNKTVMLQRFENSFFNMLNMQQSILTNIEFKIRHPELLEPYDIEDCKGRRAISETLNFLRKHHPKDRIENIIKFCSSTFDDSRIEPYFQQIYLILDYVDSASWLTSMERNIYICILQATFSTDELTMLFYFGLYANKAPRLKQLIEKYALFMNLRRTSLFSEAHYDLYERGAYEFIPSDSQGTENNIIT